MASAISLLFLTTMLAVGAASLHSFRTQLMNVMVAEQNALVGRIAEDVDQKLLALRRVLSLSAAEITEADLASPEAAQRYLNGNTGLYAAVDRAVFLLSPQGIVLAERPRFGLRGEDFSWRAYLKETTRTRQSVISEPYLTVAGDGNRV